jgi:hypothetical protein
MRANGNGGLLTQSSYVPKRTFFLFIPIEICPVAEYAYICGGGTMPKVACFEIAGLTCWFWSNDHEPSHFHAKKEGEWEIRVKFSEGETHMFESVWGDEPSGKVLRQLKKAVKENRANLLTEWEANVNQ